MIYNIDLILEELYGLQRLGIKVGLEHTVQLLDKIGNPHNKLKFIHNPEFLTARTAFDDFHNQTQYHFDWFQNPIFDFIHWAGYGPFDFSSNTHCCIIFLVIVMVLFIFY